MAPRQVKSVGKRREGSAMQARGIARREELQKAALDLLSKKPLEEISFREIADHAGIPEGSAYHFYANKFDIFAALAKVLSELFVQAHGKPYDVAKIHSWHDISDLIVDRGAEVYKSSPAAQQLLIGGKTPPEIKQLDRINDHQVGEVIESVFEGAFVLPPLPRKSDIFYLFIEVTDLIFSLSVIENGKITADMQEEAKRVGRGYLGTYLPPVLERRLIEQA